VPDGFVMFVTFVMPIHNHDMSRIWMSHVSHIDLPCVDVPAAFVTPNAATHCTLHLTAIHCNTLHTAVHCNTMQHTATHCLPSLAVPAAFVTQNPSPASTAEYTATHCNTLHHTRNTSSTFCGSARCVRDTEPVAHQHD